MDYVALPFTEAKQQLHKTNTPYTVTVTKPTRTGSSPSWEQYYVIKQRIDADGVYHLVVAAKMRKEV